MPKRKVLQSFANDPLKVLRSRSVKRKKANGPCYDGLSTARTKEKQTKVCDSSDICEEVNKCATSSVRGFPTGNKFVGAHVSVSGGIFNAPCNAASIGACSFAMFLRNQRKWDSKPLLDDDAELFKRNCALYGYDTNMIVPHGIYLMNCGSPDSQTLAKSKTVLIDEHKRCERLGLKLYNFHPGSTCGKISVSDSIAQIADCINAAHAETSNVITLIENMSCQGSTIGGRFEELRDLISAVQDKSRIGICFDTCHAFAAGYDIRTENLFNKVMQEFDDVVGLRYLRAVHLNDSKGDLGCHRDRHEHIGEGKIGEIGFRILMNDSRFENIPMVIETPDASLDRKNMERLRSYVRT